MLAERYKISPVEIAEMNIFQQTAILEFRPEVYSGSSFSNLAEYMRWKNEQGF